MIDIPVLDPSPALAAQHKLTERGRTLMRQDAWDKLSQQMRFADAERRKTPGYLPEAQFLSQGARSDVLRAAKRGFELGEVRQIRAATLALESILDDDSDSVYARHLVASAHLDVAQAWTSEHVPQSLRGHRKIEHAFHMEAAAAHADMFDPFQTSSALWASLRCAVLEQDAAPRARVADDYQDLIELDPQDPSSMRAFGRDLVPGRFGSFETLGLEARRVTALVSDVWGHAGYTWMFMGAMEQDKRVVDHVDAELFIAGMHDILSRFHNQHMVNRLAAFTGYTLSGVAERKSAKARIANCFEWLVTEHLREVHPEIWCAARNPELGDWVSPGKGNIRQAGTARALSAIAVRFARQLTRGERMEFRPSGLVYRAVA